jgi:hypothetical protein
MWPVVSFLRRLHPRILRPTVTHGCAAGECPGIVEEAVLGQASRAASRSGRLTGADPQVASASRPSALAAACSPAKPAAGAGAPVGRPLRCGRCRLVRRSGAVGIDHGLGLLLQSQQEPLRHAQQDRRTQGPWPKGSEDPPRRSARQSTAAPRSSAAEDQDQPDPGCQRARIGYVTPNDEHQGRGPAIRKARQAVLYGDSGDAGTRETFLSVIGSTDCCRRRTSSTSGGHSLEERETEPWRRRRKFPSRIASGSSKHWPIRPQNIHSVRPTTTGIW